MIFASPLWLAAGVSVIVPILIHLFGRPRPRLQRFPSLMLLRRVQAQRRSTTRVRRIISLILRCLALLLLAMVLAGPLSDLPAIARLGEPLGATAIILDTSPSMSATTGSGRPIDRAREMAGTLLAELRDDEAVVVLLSDGDAPADLRPAEARGLLTAAALGECRARLGDRIADVIEGRRRPARTFVITDMQSTSLSPLPSVPGAPTQMFVLDAGAEITGNSAVTDLRSSAQVHLRTRPIDLIVEARTWGESPGRVPVVADCGREPLTAGIDLLPDARAAASLELPPVEPGIFACKARLPADALRADDTRTFVTRVHDRLRVAVLGPRERARFIEAALDPFPADDPRSTIEVVDASALTAGPPLHAVVIAAAALSDDEVAAVQAAAQRGAGVLAFADAPPALLAALSLDAVSIGEAVRRDDGAALAEMATDRPPLSGFAEPGAGDLTSARFTAVPRVRIDAHGDLTVLARYDDGTPALIEGAVGRGRALLFATSPDDAWGDLVRVPEFVPLMHRLVAHLAAGVEPAILAGAPGEPTVGTAPAGADELTIVGPDGREEPAQMQNGRWRFLAASRGTYTLRSAGEDSAAFAVNLDTAESDPARLSADEARRRLRPLSARIVDADALAGLVERLGPAPADISSLVALLALLVVAVEAVQSLQARESPDGDR